MRKQKLSTRANAYARGYPDASVTAAAKGFADGYRHAMADVRKILRTPAMGSDAALYAVDQLAHDYEKFK